MITELFTKMKAAEVDIKKDNQVLMVNKTTSFKKAKVQRNPSRKAAASALPLPRRSSSLV
jgi:hypothetical protein